MSNIDPTSLPDIYRDYLAGLQEAEREHAFEALARWNRFLEGRSPGEVDGTRREWFELTQEETGLSAERIREISDYVKRFYEWLATKEPKTVARATARPSPTVAPGLPPPPPELARDPNLFKQGPSIGPPPSDPRRPAPIDAQLGHAVSKTAHHPARRPVLWGLIALFALAAFALPVPYILFWSPQADFEADIETYLKNADRAQMEAFYRWLPVRGSADGFEVDVQRVEVARTPLLGTRSDLTEMHRLDVRVPARQECIGIRRYVVLEASAYSIHKLPEPPPLPQIAGSTSRRTTRKQAAALDAQDAERLLELLGRIQTAIASYRQVVPSAPREAARLLYSDVDSVRAALTGDPVAAFRGPQLLGEIADELIDMSESPPPLVELENRLFQIETRLRQAERYIRADAPSAP